MKRRRVIKLAIILLVVLFASFGTFLWSQYIVAERQERERHFVTVHFIAMQPVMTPEDEPPNTIKELMEMYAGGGADSAILKPFRNGLIYQRTPRGFNIFEPQQEFVSLFRRDRLVASDHDWPHWESSGIKVWKYPGQQVPPNYLTQEAEQAVGGNAVPPAP